MFVGIKHINLTFSRPVSQDFAQRCHLIWTLWPGIGNVAAEQSADRSGWLESLKAGALGTGRELEV